MNKLVKVKKEVIRKVQTWAYCRVSSRDQNEDRQIMAMHEK